MSLPLSAAAKTTVALVGIVPDSPIVVTHPCTRLVAAVYQVVAQDEVKAEGKALGNHLWHLVSMATIVIIKICGVNFLVALRSIDSGGKKRDCGQNYAAERTHGNPPWQFGRGPCSPVAGQAWPSTKVVRVTGFRTLQPQQIFCTMGRALVWEE